MSSPSSFATDEMLNKDVINIGGKLASPEDEGNSESISAAAQSNGSISKEDAQPYESARITGETPILEADNILATEPQDIVLPDSDDGVPQEQVTSNAVEEQPSVALDKVAEVASDEPVKITEPEPDLPSSATVPEATSSSAKQVVHSEPPADTVTTDTVSTKPKSEGVEKPPSPSAVASAEPAEEKQAPLPQEGGNASIEPVTIEDKPPSPSLVTSTEPVEAPLPQGGNAGTEPVTTEEPAEPVENTDVTAEPGSEEPPREIAEKAEAESAEKPAEETDKMADDAIEEDTNGQEAPTSRKRGGRGRGRGHRGRVQTSRQSKRTEPPPELPVEDEKEGEAGEKMEVPSAVEVPDREHDAPATKPKRKRRTGVDAALAAEAKARAEETAKSEAGRVLRSRYQSPPASGSETKTRRGGDYRPSVEKVVQRKRVVTKMRSPNSSSSSTRQRSKRGRMSSSDLYDSAGSDGDGPSARRSRRGDTPVADETDKTQHKQSTSGRGRGRRSRGNASTGGRKKTNDIFDFDETVDTVPAGPFRRVNLSKSNFGDMKFTKAEEKLSGKSKYTITSKAGDLSKQQTGGSGVVSPKTDGTSVRSPSPDLTKQVNPEKEKHTNIRGSQSRYNKSRSFASKSYADSSSALSDNDASSDYRSISPANRSAKRGLLDGYSEEPIPPRKKRQRRTKDQVTPKPKEPQLAKLTPEEQLNADFPPQNTAALLPGTRVLSRWIDKCFYAAVVLTDEGFGHYKVRFYDGAVRSKPRPDLVPVAKLKKGDVLMVSKESDGGDAELEPVTIKKPPSSSNSEEWFNCIFEVENEVQERTERHPWEKFIIDVDQTKNFVTTLVNKAAQDITADNITEKKERKARSRGGETQQDEAEEDQEDSEKQSPSPPPRPQRTRSPRVAPSRRSDAASTTPAAGSSPKPRRSGTSAREETSVRTFKVASPSRRHQPPPQIFNGLSFVLTSANRRTKENDSSEEEKPTTITFNKKHVRQLIEDHGGLVVDEFVQVPNLSRCYLIADTHYRTHKYLSALARAVPCVKHTWVHESCSAKHLLDSASYMLAAGYSLEGDNILPWHDKCPTLLSGNSVLVYTENRPNNPSSLDFIQIWAPLVKCMGAKVITIPPDADSDRVDILLTDATCSAAQLQTAKDRGARPVSSEWLIQAIITGRQPRPDGHKKYEYDYVEVSTATSSTAAATAPTPATTAASGSASENPTP